MSNIKDGGPAFPCSICGNKATMVQGHQHLCDKHYRFRQMRSLAKRRNKLVPTRAQLETMDGVDLHCPDCQCQMNWRSSLGYATVASLQHYRDGTMAIVCRSCNTRHAFMPGDTYRDMPKDHKLCPKCQTVKPRFEFTVDNSRSGLAKRKSRCRTCSDEIIKKWKELNREKYNQYQRAYREKRKANGNPVLRRS